MHLLAVQYTIFSRPDITLALHHLGVDDRHSDRIFENLEKQLGTVTLNQQINCRYNPEKGFKHQVEIKYVICCLSDLVQVLTDNFMLDTRLYGLMFQILLERGSGTVNFRGGTECPLSQSDGW